MVGGSGWAVVAGLVVVATVVIGSSKAPAGTTISVASSGVSTTMRLVPAASLPGPQAVTASTKKQVTTTLLQSMNTPLRKSKICGYREARWPLIVGQKPQPNRVEIEERIEPGGGDGNRTHDLYVANVAL